MEGLIAVLAFAGLPLAYGVAVAVVTGKGTQQDLPETGRQASRSSGMDL